MKKYCEVRPISDIRDLLRTSGNLHGPRNAFLEKRNGVYTPITYYDYLSDVEGLCAAWHDMGLTSKKIILIGENCYNWALTYMSVLFGIGVIVPVDKEMPADEVANIAAICEAAAVIYSDNYESKVADIGDDIIKIPFSELSEYASNGKMILESGDASSKYLTIDPNALAVLLFTSGTTGVSKGVMLSQHNICSNLQAMTKMAYIGPEDIFLSVLPLHHTYECTCGFLAPLYCGCTIAYAEKIATTAKNLKETHATIILCVPLLAETLYKKIWQNAAKKGKAEALKKGIKINNAAKKLGIDLSRKLFKEVHETLGGRLRWLVVGGAAADPKVLSGLRDLGIMAFQGYGLTECAPLAAVNRGEIAFRDASAGLCPPGGELSIYSADKNGVGEIRYRGDNVMLGYYNDKELTDEVIRDGWFYTGDLGYIDKDGFLYISGRKKNVIVTANGKNIFPEELEVYLARNEFIKESMVVGEDNERGELIIKAIIYPNYERLDPLIAEKGIRPGDDGYDDEVRGFFHNAIKDINASVPSYKAIRKFVVRKRDFEKTTTNKIKRFSLFNKSQPDDIN